VAGGRRRTTLAVRGLASPAIRSKIAQLIADAA
jgi:hypothetical protein